MKKVSLVGSFMVALAVAVALLAAPDAWAADCSAGSKQLAVMSGGQMQRAALVLPSTKAGARMPLVIGLHPSGGTGQSFDDDTGLVSAATKKGFAVLLPDGALSTDDGKGHFWNIPGVPLTSGAEVPQGTRDD